MIKEFSITTGTSVFTFTPLCPVDTRNGQMMYWRMIEECPAPDGMGVLRHMFHGYTKMRTTRRNVLNQFFTVHETERRILTNVGWKYYKPC